MENYRTIEIELEFEEEEDDYEEDYDDIEEYEQEFYDSEEEEEEDVDDEEEDVDDEEEEDDDEEEEGEEYEDGEEEEEEEEDLMIPRGTFEDDDYQDEDYEDEDMEELVPIDMGSPRVSNSIIHGQRLEGTVVINNGLPADNSNDRNPINQESNRDQTDSLFCPICFDAWTSGGDHQVCCLPCGHIYGLSCIKRWLQQFQSHGKCPQCNDICTSKDIRVLYISRLCAADEELHKRVRALELKCAYLEEKAASQTPEKLIDQICSKPMLVQRLSAALAELQIQQENR